MKYIIALIGALALTSCNEFDRYYDKIDGEFARAVSFYYETPEMAPGDTVTLRSFFTGKSVNAANVKWGVSWQFLQNVYGENKTLDSQSLDKWIVEPMHLVSATSDSLQQFEMKFVIPDSIMRKSPGIPENWMDEFEKYGQSLNISSEEFAIPQDKQGLLNMFDSISLLPPSIKAEVPYDLGKQLDGVCQFLSVGFKIYCDYQADGGFSGELLHTVRYHSKFKGIPGVYTNNRPVQTGAKLYVVSGDVSFFDPETTPFITSTVVDKNAFSVTYADNQSYFLEVTLDGRDSVLSTESIFTGKIGSGREEYTSYWMYETFAFQTMGLRQQEDNSDEKAGKTRMIFKMEFGESGEIVRGKPMKYYLESSDRKLGTSYRPEGKDLQMYMITVL